MQFNLKNHPFKKFYINSGWLIADKVFRMVVGLFIGVWVARYLGPKSFGSLNYALAFTALFSVFSNLGLDQIVVRDIVDKSNSGNCILGSAFFLKIFGSVLAILLACVTIHLYKPNDSEMFAMVLILSIGTLFQSFDVIDYYYQAKLQSKLTVYARNFAFLLNSLVKIALIALNFSAIYFALAYTFEIFLGSLCLLITYWFANHALKSWRPNLSEMKRLLVEGAPLFFSGFLVLLYIRIDQLMIGSMLGDEQLGIYSVAVRLAEVWYFIPMAIASSILPAIVEAKNQGTAAYKKILRNLYALMTWLSIVVAILLSIFSDVIVKFLFGHQYEKAGPVLAIQCWSAVFIFSGLISNHWYLVENLNRFTLYRHILGLIINLILNFILIPIAGIEGSAWATLITQLMISYLFELLSPKTRDLFFIRGIASLYPIIKLYQFLKNK